MASRSLNNRKHFLLQCTVPVILLLLLQVAPCYAVWPFGGDTRVEVVPPIRSPKAVMKTQGSLPHFEMEGGSGYELAEQYARQNGLIEAGNDCRQRAYAELQRSCREIMQVADTRHRLAIQFANCFAAESGKPVFPCPEKKSIKACTAPMDNHSHSSYLSFYIHVDAVCHHLQTEYFAQRTEGIVNRLVQTSHRTAEQLSSVSEMSKTILERADKSLELQRSLETRQEGFRTLLEGSMADVTNATWRVRESVDDVIQRQESAAARSDEIWAESARVMGRLETQTGRVSDGVSKSLENQGRLLQGQEEAVREFTQLREEQENAFRVHTERLRELGESAGKHAREVAEFHAGMEATQARLADGSAKMLEQQASFATKQADVFTSLDRMFTLYGSIVSESLALKSLLFYAAAVTIAYVLTATKMTHNARFWLYCGLTANFAVECALVRYLDPAAQPTAVAGWMQFTRAAFGLYSLAVLGLSILTYRDYAALSYSLLEAQSARLADIEKRLYQPPAPLEQPNDSQLEYPASEEPPRHTLSLPDVQEEGLDVRAYWAEAKTWEDGNAEPSSSDESYLPRRGVEGPGFRWRGGYNLRPRPRPAWSGGQDVLQTERVEDFAAMTHARSLFYRYATDLLESSSDETTALDSYCDSHLDEDLADEASSLGLVIDSTWAHVSSPEEVPENNVIPRRSRRQSAAC